MTRPYAISFSARAARQVQKERAWLHDQRGSPAANAFEAELRHRLDLVSENPEMGHPSDESPDERCTFLWKSRFHVFYVVNHRREAVRVVRLRHERQNVPR